MNRSRFLETMGGGWVSVDQALHWADPLMQGMSITHHVGAPVPTVTHLLLLQFSNRQGFSSSNYRKAYASRFPSGKFIPEYGWKDTFLVIPDRQRASWRGGRRRTSRLMGQATSGTATPSTMRTTR